MILTRDEAVRHGYGAKSISLSEENLKAALRVSEIQFSLIEHS